MARPETPQITVDTIIELTDRPGNPIILIERKYPPLGWAIPGGFVDFGETLETAAIREAKEEISLVIELRVLLGNYSSPERDPRGHTVTACYVATANGQPVAADDARHVEIFSIDALPSQLAFDHEMVLADYKRYREQGNVAPLRVQ
jgi:8-oxo-dGTP diphosphatase